MSHTMDFTILENIKANIIPSLSQVVFDRPFVEITKLISDREQRVVLSEDDYRRGYEMASNLENRFYLDVDKLNPSYKEETDRINLDGTFELGEVKASLSWLSPDAIAKVLTPSLDRLDAVARNCHANANPPPTNNRPVLPATLRAQAIQEFHELQKFSAFVESRLESVKRFLNDFTNQPNETNMNDLESDDQSLKTMLFKRLKENAQRTRIVDCVVQIVAPTTVEQRTSSIKTINAVSPNFGIAGQSTFMDPSKYPDDPDMSALEDIVYSDDEKVVDVEADLSNLKTNIPVNPILTTRVHKDHPINQIIARIVDCVVQIVAPTTVEQ
nr:hypothetical protein [Tanacetum cinerariifolium]